MKRLGELLVARGALDVSELRTALEACHRRGDRLGTQLLRFGFVEERSLLEALSEQLGVPFIPEALLASSPWAVRQLVPLEVLQRLQAIPFERSQWRLRVAMANPRDPAALEELTSQAGIEVEPYVATESAILKTLKRLAQQEAQSRGRAPSAAPLPAADGTRQQAPGPRVVADWEQLWRPPRTGPADLLRCRGSRRGAEPKPLLSTYPDLEPVVEIPGITIEAVLDDSLYARGLQEAADRDQVGSLLLRFATRFIDRVSLFALHRGRVVGWMARGPGVVIDDIQSFAINLSESSLFLNAYESGHHSMGTIPAEPAHKLLISVLGEPQPLHVFLAPIRAAGQTVAFLLGDNPGERGGGIPTQELLSGATKAGYAIEILALKHKISG